MSDLNKVDFSPLHSYPSLKQLLKELGISGQFLKKFPKLKKRFVSSVEGKRAITLPIELLNYQNVQSINSSINILFENDDFIAIEKNINEHSHPLIYSDTNTTLSRVLHHRPSLKFVNKYSMDRAAVYRLDYETSGVLFFAKTDRVYKEVRRQSSAIRQKIYMLICHGQVEKSILTNSLSRQGTKVVRNDEESSVHLRILKTQFNEEKNLSLVKVELFEGVRHQIRAQFSLNSTPLLGDLRYGGEAEQRLYLHCLEYSIELDGRLISALCPTPELFKRFFNFNS